MSIHMIRAYLLSKSNSTLYIQYPIQYTFLCVCVCLCVFLYLYVCVCVCVCVCDCAPLSLFLSFYLSVYVSVCESVCLCMYINITVHMCFFVRMGYVRTVPYESDNFANYKMDNFSLIFIKKNFLETDCNFFLCQSEVYLKVKKLFKAKKQCFKKHSPNTKWEGVIPSR